MVLFGVLTPNVWCHMVLNGVELEPLLTGAVTLLENKLNRSLLWLACRHHISELYVKAAFVELFGQAKAPFFQDFKGKIISWVAIISHY